MQALREAEKAASMAARKDYYKILGVDRQCDDRDIKKARRHPLLSPALHASSPLQATCWTLPGLGHRACW